MTRDPEGPEGFARGLARLDFDPAAPGLPRAHRARRVRRAMAMGRAAAERVVAGYGTRDPRALAARLGVRIEMRSMPPAVPWLTVGSEYYTAPPRIVLYKDSLPRVAARLGAPGRALSEQAVADLHVAHELFHHLEEREGITVAGRLAYARWRLGPWRWRVRVPALREVAAHAFAQALLDLPWSPLEHAR